MTDIHDIHAVLFAAGLRLSLNPDGLRLDITTEPPRPITDDEFALIRHNKRALMALLKDMEMGLFFESHGIPGRGASSSA